MLKNGYIFAHRSLLDWGWYKDVPTCKLWFHLLLCANYEPCEFMGEKIAAGEFATSYVSLANGSGLTVKQVRNALDKLKKTGEISVRTNRHYSVITISKYDEYQRQFFANRADKGQTECVAAQVVSDFVGDNRADKGQTKGRQRADRGQTEGTQGATMEEYNKAIQQKSKKDYMPRENFSGDQDTSKIQSGFLQPGGISSFSSSPSYRPEWFERFWALYPRKTAKSVAAAAWDAISPDRELCDKMANAIREQMKSKQWQDPQYIPQAAKWLNEARWEDEVEDGDQNHTVRMDALKNRDFQPTPERIQKNIEWMDAFLAEQDRRDGS